MSVRGKTKTTRTNFDDRNEHETRIASRPGVLGGTHVEAAELAAPRCQDLERGDSLVAIGRNRAGLWVARDCDSSTGRAFIFQRLCGSIRKADEKTWRVRPDVRE
jgi:hypothetical protein